MPPTPRDLVIDARPRGPRGPLAGEHVLGRTVLDHLLELATAVTRDPVPIHVRLDEHLAIHWQMAARRDGRFPLVLGPPPEGAAILRTDRLYDLARLRRALRRGKDPEAAAIWRLDRPEGLASADDELLRRRTYQPLGRFWALEPARGIARWLAPTRVRPNAVTLAASTLLLAASATVAWAPPGWPASLGSAIALALALVLDTADGHLARLQGTASEFGRWLDAWLDELCDMALHAAIAWSAFTQSSNHGWLLLGMLYAMGKYVFFVGVADWREGPVETSNGAVALTPAASSSFVRTAIHLAGHADVRWHLWIVLAAIGRLDIALVAYAVYFPARAVLGAARKAVRHA